MTTEVDHGIGEAVAARVERRWATLSIVIVGVLVGMATYIGIHQATMPQGHVETADPKMLHLAGEFVESNLGSAVEPDGSITVRIIAEQYMFVPQCAVVPASTPVRFRLTSADVTHGFFVQNTNTNAMVVPGYITSVRTSFERPGTYQMPCDEFCGFGHHAMAARVVVVPRDQFTTLRPDERMNCGTR